MAVITHPCPNFKVQIWHEWLIASHSFLRHVVIHTCELMHNYISLFIWLHLFIRVPNPCSFCSAIHDCSRLTRWFVSKITEDIFTFWIDPVIWNQLWINDTCGLFYTANVMPAHALATSGHQQTRQWHQSQNIPFSSSWKLKGDAIMSFSCRFLSLIHIS